MLAGACQADDARALTGLRHAAGGPPQALIAQVYGYSVDLGILSVRSQDMQLCV